MRLPLRILGRDWIFGEHNRQTISNMNQKTFHPFVLHHIWCLRSKPSCASIQILFCSYLSDIMLCSLLYFASVILAHRPFWSVPEYYEVCIQASQSIEKLVLLLESTFGLKNITYLMGYCIYTGASAILEDAKKQNNEAFATLRTFLRALNTGTQCCPLLERSLNIIMKGLNRAPIERGTVVNQTHPLESSMAANGYIPAFPYADPPDAINFDINPYLIGTDIGALPILDCYPEMQVDFTDMLGTLH